MTGPSPPCSLWPGGWPGGLTFTFSACVTPTGAPTRLKQFTHHAIGVGQRYGVASATGWVSLVRTILAQHRRTPFDLLHALWADEAGFCAALVGRLIGRPIVVSLGGWELVDLPDIAYGAQRLFIRRLTTRFALTQAQRVTAGSQYQLNLCRQHGVAEQKLHWAPLGVDTGVFSSSASQRSPNPTLLQVASLLPVKNQRLLLETFALVRQNLPNAKLHIVGDGPLGDDLQQYAAALGLGEAVTWFGAVPHLELPARYQQADIYVQTSRHESQGVAVLEALACGLPVVGTPVGLLPEVGQTGTTAEELATRIVAVWQHLPHHHAEPRRAVQPFSAEASGERFLMIYESLRSPSL